VHPHDGGEETGANHQAATGALAIVQGRHDSKSPIHAGQQVADGDADTCRILRRRTGQRHQSGLPLGDLVIPRAPTFRAVVSEASDRQHHQPRVDLLQFLHREPQPVQHSGAEVLDQHIRVLEETAQRRMTVLALQVERDRLLVAIAGQEVR